MVNWRTDLNDSARNDTSYSLRVLVNIEAIASGYKMRMGIVEVLRAGRANRPVIRAASCLLLLFGLSACETSYTSQQLTERFYGANSVEVEFFAEPGGALIYRDGGVALGIAPAKRPSDSPAKLIAHFSSKSGAQKGYVAEITAVWPSGARATQRVMVDTSNTMGRYVISRPMSAPNLQLDLDIANRVASQPALQPPPIPQAQPDDTSYVAESLAAFARGWVQAQAASQYRQPVMCTTTMNKGMANTFCQ